MSPSATINAAIGRYEIVRALGEGAGVSTYLATDTRLARSVVLKTLRGDAANSSARDARAAALETARQVGTLAHPNIIPLLDAGEEAGVLFLVFEYVEGHTIATLLATGEKFSTTQALGVAREICRGLAHAHERAIAHGDVRAATVMVTPEGTARLMNFAALRGTAKPGDARATPADDLRALGELLCQMLTGSTAEAMRHAAILSLDAGQVDPRLAQFLDAALASPADGGFDSAAAMGAALTDLLDTPPSDAAGPAAKATLDYLLRKIRLKGDFPALSATISAVNRAAASDREPVGVLCNAILKDLALTGRLLKIVNGSHLNQFGGSISTVSRAVAILGYDAVRNVSMSLALFEHMHDRANAVALKDQVVGIYFSGLLARVFVESAGLQDAELAFICAMFHRLGKMLGTFYLHDEALAVERHILNHGWSEERASREVLGLSYEELGIGVARAWNLPEEIVQSMRGYTGQARERPSQNVEKLKMLAGLANEIADMVQKADDSTRKESLAQIVRRYGPSMGITERSLVAAIELSAKALARDADSLSRGVARSPFLRSAGSWLLTPEVRAPGDVTVADGPLPRGATVPAGLDDTAGGNRKPAPATDDVAPATQRVVDEARLDAGSASPKASEPARRRAALTAGVQEITSALVGDHTLNDVLRIIVETIYRAMGFQRVLLFSLDPRDQSLRCRFGFGANADVITQKRISIPLHGKRDLFHAAVVMGADLCIEDLDSEKIRAHVPQWYRSAIGAHGILLLPIVHRKRTLGLVYADSDTPEALRFTPEELSLLKTLRNQALLAMRQNA